MLKQLIQLIKMAEQMTKVKVYILRSGTKSEYKTKYGGELITLKFSGGGRSPQFIPGRLVTSDPKVQEAIEGHPKYGSEFYLDQARTARSNNPQPAQQAQLEKESAPPKEPTTPIDLSEKKKRVGYSQAQEEARIIQEGIRAMKQEGEIEKIRESKSKEAPDHISTVAEAGSWLRENFDGVKASSVNTRAGIKQIAEDMGVSFPSMEL